MKAVINRSTRTVHKRAAEGSKQTPCGATTHVDSSRLQHTSLQRARAANASKCGRCFEDGGGY